ncbi:hypothetical protein GCM10029964_065230 [Kibdelosporangium lantanae]
MAAEWVGGGEGEEDRQAGDDGPLGDMGRQRDLLVLQHRDGREVQVVVAEQLRQDDRGRFDP